MSASRDEQRRRQVGNTRRAEGRDETVIATMFGVSVLAAIGLAVVYWRGGQPQLEGALLAVASGGIAVGLITWSHRLLPGGRQIEERVDLTSAPGERDAFDADLDRGGVLSRRRFLRRSLGAALGALGLAFVLPLRSLGPRPSDAALELEPVAEGDATRHRRWPSRPRRGRSSRRAGHGLPGGCSELGVRAGRARTSGSRISSKRSRVGKDGRRKDWSRTRRSAPMPDARSGCTKRRRTNCCVPATSRRSTCSTVQSRCSGPQPRTPATAARDRRRRACLCDRRVLVASRSRVLGSAAVTAKRVRIAAVSLAVGTASLAGCGGHSPSMLHAEGSESQRIAGIWWLMFGLGAGVYAVVASFIIWAIVRGRRSAAGEGPASDNTWIVWGGVIVPVVILAMLAVVTVQATTELRKPESKALKIEVVGKRWWWQVSYVGTRFTTANEIHLPVGRPVEIGLDSDNVIHSFWVPELAGKVDMIPGQHNVLRFTPKTPGTYRRRVRGVLRPRARPDGLRRRSCRRTRTSIVG